MKNESIEKLRSLFFDQADLIFTLFDKDLFCIDVNETALKKLHLKKEDMVGKHISEISPDIKSSGRYSIYQEVIRTGKTFFIDDAKTHPSLGDFYSRIKAFKVSDGLGVISTDITGIKGSIEDFEMLTYKSSHDLRAPIASVLGLIELAENDIKDLDTAKKNINIIKQQVERLDATTLQQILDAKKVNNGEKTISQINFREITDDVLRSLAYMKGINEIHTDINILSERKFYSDKSLIISIFQNLIDNAIKYKKENINDSFLKIVIEDENGEVKITFADNGIGIAEHLQSDIFNKFFRTTDKSSGTGLGLYTLKHYIKKLGGQIKLNSKEGVGSTFTIYLPNEKIE
jgi:signal transduction histidine kinase